MKMTEVLLKDMEHEALTTRKMLALVPDNKNGWKPHERSMPIEKLAAHIAELPGWADMVLTTDELDFAQNPYVFEPFKNNAGLMAFFEKKQADGTSRLKKASDNDLELKWTLRNGEQILNVATKAEVIRMCINQVVHHRAQLGVYLRLLNIPIPGSYGPSADELAAMAATQPA